LTFGQFVSQTVAAHEASKLRQYAQTVCGVRLHDHTCFWPNPSRNTKSGA
jgi:hypothetical protein